MKKFFAVLLTCLMLLASCGGETSSNVTEAPDVTDAHKITDVTETNAPESDAPLVTDAPETEPAETEPPVQREDYTIEVTEDTYVYKAVGGEEVDNNFGSDADLQLKSSPNAPTRFTYLKFDISSLVGDNDFTAVDLSLMLKLKQNDPGNPETAVVEIYGAPADAWSENTLTFNTQPDHYEKISSRDDVAGTGKVFDFPVASYIKHALSKGETMVAFYIKESTSVPLHIKFESKESEKQSPELKVYYGTKVDDSVYAGSDVFAEPTLSKTGFDNVVGLNKSELKRIEVIEDTFVQAGSTADTNFGDSKELDFKALAAKPNEYYRIVLLKFDISSIKDYEYAKAFINLNCTSMEKYDVPTRVNVYGCYPSDWQEMTVTYNTLPEREELIATYVVRGEGNNRIDVTDYIKRMSNAGYQDIAFYLEGDADSIRRLKFSSKEDGYNVPCIVLTDGSIGITTVLNYIGENPWDVAMERVSTWLHRWETIKAREDDNIETIKKDNSEYSLNVGATTESGTKGAETKYTNYPTRLVSTLNGYTASTAETEKYDIYGGLVDESLKQEATGFFYSKKIGDRWWTIDPLGYPFFRTAIVAIGMGNSKQSVALKAKYGDTAGWAQETTDRMRELGFNSAGGWSSTANLIKADEPITQTGIMYVLKKYCQANGLDISESGNTTLVNGIMPVFDPEFEISADETVKNAVLKYATDSNIYGWMSDNELPRSDTMLDSSLMVNTNDTRFNYTYAVAWTFMYLKTGKADVSLEDVTDELRKEFRAMVYDRYYEVVASALDRYAPYHQYMGCRLLTNAADDEYIMRVSGYWCDVITYNYYNAWDADFELVSNQVNWAGKPFVVTEWYAKGMDVWEKDNRMTNKSGAGWTVKDQKARGQFYQNFALSLLECKGCVGFDWFKYLDNDPDDLTADLSNRNSNKGFVDNEGNEYTELAEYMGELNNQKYNIIRFFDAR